MKRRPFVRLDEAGAKALKTAVRRGTNLDAIRLRLPALVGDYLARKLTADSFRAGRLELRLNDPSCRRAIEPLRDAIAEKIRRAMPEIRTVDFH